MSPPACDARRTDPRLLPPATGYSYALPGGWVHLDVEPARRAASVRRALSCRIRREPRLAPHLAQLDRLLLHECAVAAAVGAARVSLLAEVCGPSVLTAAVTFLVRSVPGGAALDAAGAAELLALDHRRARADDASAELETVALSQGEAVRRAWSQAGPGLAGELARHRLLQVVVPWPGRPAVGLLTLSSSAGPLWPALEATFDACAASFHWTWEA